MCIVEFYKIIFESRFFQTRKSNSCCVHSDSWCAGMCRNAFCVYAGLADGAYTAEVAFSGGSGKSHIASPVTLTVKDGAVTATVVWSSSNYDYMVVDGEHYDVLTTEPGSTFEIPVAAFDTDLTVIGDTTAMSTPHEIEYTLNFASATLTPAG